MIVVYRSDGEDWRKEGGEEAGGRGRVDEEML